MSTAEHNDLAVRNSRVEATIEDRDGEAVITPRTLVVASLASALLIFVALVTAPVASAPTTHGTSR